jgi:hypothetical protein
MLTLPNFWHFVAQVSRRFLRETWGFFARHLAAAGHRGGVPGEM